MQGVVRTGNLVQGIDVSVRNKNDIVLFVVDEGANNQSLYLTSPEGILRRLVLVNAGVGSVARITEKDQEAFKKEKKFWVDIAWRRPAKRNDTGVEPAADYNYSWLSDGGAQNA